MQILARNLIMKKKKKQKKTKQTAIYTREKNLPQRQFTSTCIKNKTVFIKNGYAYRDCF